VTSARRFETRATLAALALAAAIAAVIAFGAPRPLALVEAHPPDGATGVSVMTQVRLSFNRPLDEASAREALSVDPQADGFVSAAGRRIAFTPRSGFRLDTDYAIAVGGRLRDRAGRPLEVPATIRFRTRGQALIVRGPDGRLSRVPFSGGEIAGALEPVAPERSGPFAVGPTGEVAYVASNDRALVIAPGARGAARRIALPRGVDVRDLAFAPSGGALVLLGADERGVGAPYLVRLDQGDPAVEPFGPRPRELAEMQIVEKLKRSLIRVVYQRETFAFTPDGRGAIIRDETWDYAVYGFDGARRGTFGAFLAVGNASPRGDFVAFVDVDPADGLLRRQILAYEKTGRLRSLSSRDRDSHSPRFAHRNDRIVFVTGEPAGPPGARRFALEVIDLADGTSRRLTEPPSGESDVEPLWAPDDAWISFRRVPVDAPGRGELWVVSPDGGPARRLALDVTDARWIP
jgi:hypothetical protein